jgi:hypothetical protein
MALSGYVRDRFMAFALEKTLLEKMLTHMVNHRVQDFQDPLTSTLVLMASSPMQMALCEAGLLPFKTNLLPVVPYSLLSVAERRCLHEIISHVPDDQVNEAIESSGQYTLTVLPFTQNMGSSPTTTLMCKKTLLQASIGAIMKGNDPSVGRTLCNIVLQRFMAQIPTPSDIAGQIMSILNPNAVDCIQSITADIAMSDAGPRKRGFAEVADEAADEAAEDSAEEAADEAAEDSAEEAADEAAEDSAEEAADEAAEDSAEEAADEAAEAPPPKVQDKPKKPRLFSLPSIYAGKPPH